LRSSLKELLDSDSELVDIDKLEELYLEHLSKGERRRLGQVFTPHYIIRFILHQIPALAKLKEIPSTFRLKMLDPACGLGRFLLEAYDFLEKKLRERGWNGDDIHNFLVGKCLHGLDIEPLAVYFTKFALNLKKRDYEIDISLVRESNVLDWPMREDKFDIIMGNPPYFLISSSRRSTERGRQFHTTDLPKELIDKYRSNYKAWPKNNQDPNIFYLFIERSIQLLQEGGYLGFIIPDILLAGDSTENLREVILGNCCLTKIIGIDGQVFEDRGISNVIIILQKCSKKEVRERNKVEIIRTSTLELVENDKEGNYDIFDEQLYLTPQAIFYATPQRNFAIRMTDKNSTVFQNIFGKIAVGKLVKMGELLEIQRGIENLKKGDALDQVDSRKETCHKLITATNIEKYQINWDAAQFARKWVDYRPQDPAYAKIAFKKKEWFTQQKIVLKRVSEKLIAALDQGDKEGADFYFTLDSVQMVWLKEKFSDKLDMRVVLAILNSDFMNFYYQTLYAYKKLFARVQKAFLQELPIPAEIPDSIQRKICDCVDQLTKAVNPKIEKELNQLIYALYFTKEELSHFQNAFETPTSLRDLPGIGMAKYWELKKAGIRTLKDLIQCDVKQVARSLSGIGKKSLEKWQKEAEILLKK
jgi:type I restriction-modification system DNA methylase subunit